MQVDDLEDEHDYDRVSFTGASDDDDEVYKIPRNVVCWHDIIAITSLFSSIGNL